MELGDFRYCMGDDADSFTTDYPKEFVAAYSFNESDYDKFEAAEEVCKRIDDADEGEEFILIPNDAYAGMDERADEGKKLEVVVVFFGRVPGKGGYGLSGADMAAVLPEADHVGSGHVDEFVKNRPVEAVEQRRP